MLGKSSDWWRSFCWRPRWSRFTLQVAHWITLLKLQRITWWILASLCCHCHFEY